MTRKDYIAIARVLKNEQPCTLDEYSNVSAQQRGCYDEWGTVCIAMASMLQLDNARFDRERFLAACGVQS